MSTSTPAAWHLTCGAPIVADATTRSGLACTGDCSRVQRSEVATITMLAHRVAAERRGDHDHAGFPGGVTCAEWLSHPENAQALDEWEQGCQR